MHTADDRRSPFSLTGRTVLITGGTQGVGAAIALACAEAGADLVLQGKVENDYAKQTVRECQSRGANVHTLFMDLVPENITDSSSPIAQDLFDQALNLSPNIDCLVNNVGTYVDGDFLQFTEDIYYRTMQLNVAMSLFLTHRFAKRWIEHNVRGRIVFTGSINGFLAEQQHVVYDASKGAVAAMVRSLCTELAPKGIRVNSMAPGLVVTPLTKILDSDTQLRSWMELHTPNRRVPEAGVCGPPTVFLLSDAAEHIHGQTLYVDGGMSAWQHPDRPLG